MWLNIVKRLGMARSTLLLSGLSIALSGMIASVSEFVFFGEVRRYVLILALITPALIAPPVTAVILRLVFMLDAAREELRLLAAARMETMEKLEDLMRSLEERVREEVEKSREKDQIMQIQGRLAAMGEMLNNISHQWRQPLNNLALIIQQLQVARVQGAPSDESMKNRITECMNIIRYMSETIDDFKNFFRPDKAPRNFTLNEAVKKALTFVEASFHNRNITVRIETDGDVPAFGHPNEYTQVLINMLNNAKDVMLERRVAHPAIWIRLTRDGGFSRVVIRDNGGGVDASIQDHLFKPYVTTKTDGKGTGIGLYMSKMIIEQKMGGRLTMRNWDEGAEFTIMVPSGPARSSGVVLPDAAADRVNDGTGYEGV
jgi:signal transduction histidine kinase